MAKQLNTESSSSSDSSDESSSSNGSNSSSNSSSSSSSSSSDSETEADNEKVNKINIPPAVEDAPETKETSQDVDAQKDKNDESLQCKTEDTADAQKDKNEESLQCKTEDAAVEEATVSDVPTNAPVTDAAETEAVFNRVEDSSIAGTGDNATESVADTVNQTQQIHDEKIVSEEKISEVASAAEEIPSETAPAAEEKPPEEERKRKTADEGPEDELKRQKTAENEAVAHDGADVKKKVEVEKSSKNKDPPESKEVSRRRSRDRSRSADRRNRNKENRQRHQRSRSRSRDRRRRRTRSRSRDRGRDKSANRRRNRSPNNKRDEPKEAENPNEKITERQRRTVDLLTSRTGGAYIPPAKLRLMQAEITDKSSAAYQRIAWEALKKSIHGYINKVNVDNIGIITRELLKENIVRGRGLLCRSIIQAQAASPTFTHVYAALVAIINSKFPNIGELLLKRLVIQFKRAFRRNDKAICLSASRFIAHLVNQRVAHEILALEILTLLVETPTDDSVEVAIAFLKECGMKLTEVSSKGIGAIFEMLKNILHEGKLDKRVQYMIEVVFQVRKDGFKDHQSVIEALELVEEDDQFTHLLMLDEATTTEDNLNAFKFDDKYETNEDKYKGLSKEILGSDASDSDEEGSGSGSDDSDSEDGDDEAAKQDAIIDNTETNLIALRRTIYLTINSSLDYEECAHKLMKMQLKPGQEIELCHMFLDCCAEQRTYEKFYGLLAQRFCSINKIYIEPFEEIFKDTYQTTHRLDTNRLRNVSKFFAHLLFTDAIGWDVLDCIKLNEDDTTSSSRIFIKILFQELAEYMGLGKLNEKLKDEVLTESLAGLFPKDNPRNTRFAINFFTSIGLGGLTDDLRQFLKNAPKNVPAINSESLPEKVEILSSSESSSSSSESSSSSSDSESSASSSSDEKSKKKKKQKKKVLVKKSSSSKQVPKKKKRRGEKKKESSSSESDSSESSSSSSSSSDSSSSESSSSSSEEEKKKRKKDRTKKTKVSTKKQSKHKDKRDVAEKKDKKKTRNEKEERVSNGKSENGLERDERKRQRGDRQYYEGGDRRDRRDERSPNRDRRNRNDYNQGSKRSGDHRAAGKSRNGSKERG